MKIISLLTLLIFSACSSHKNISIDFNSANPDLPPSVQEMLSIKDRNTVEYEIASFKAATDLANLGKREIESSNSSMALKFLSLGVRLMPYRSDLASLKKKALDGFVMVTNLMSNNNQIPCSALHERVSFLLKVAPDSFNELKNSRKGCDLFSDKKKVVKEYPLIEVFNVTEPSRDAEIENKVFKDLSEDLSYFLEAQDKFSNKAFLVNALNSMGALSLISEKLSLDPSTTDANHVALTVNYRIERYASAAFDSTSYCESVQKLIGFDRGVLAPSCSNYGFSDTHMQMKLGRGALEWINKYYNEYLPQKLFFSLIMKFSDGTFKQYDYVNGKLPINDPYKWDHFVNDRSFAEKYICWTRGVCVFESINEQGIPTIKINIEKKELTLGKLSQDLIKGLKSIELKFDRQKTYEFYKDIKLQKDSGVANDDRDNDQ